MAHCDGARRGLVQPKRRKFEQLEGRRLLDGEPLSLDFDPDLFVPSSPGEQAVVDKVGTELAWLHADWSDYQAAGGAVAGSFAVFSAAGVQYGFAVQDGLVAVEAFAADAAASIRDELSAIGFQESAAFGRGLTGWLPLGSIDELAGTAGLNFARLAQGGVTNAGIAISQGDEAQLSDDARDRFTANGANVIVGVISDSFDVSASAAGSAAQDVSTGDLPPSPSSVNVLDDTRSPNQVIDEGRAMLQIVHDVAPNAGLAFHTAGTSQTTMASGIQDLRAAGADVIVDDVIFLAEPMFQDGVIAQAVDSVVSNGAAYFSSAGNLARKSYQSSFNAGPLVDISGVLETAHEFNPATDDIFQRVTVPTGGIFRLSFQWDSPFASAGGVGSSNDLNIYLVNPATSTVVAQGRTSNIGGDAVEVPAFLNNTAYTQFDVLITSAAGSLPGIIKYVDFGSGVTFNEYPLNASTLFGHANSEGAIAVGAASFLRTPAFGVSLPELESFSAPGGNSLLFDVTGNRLTTPIFRQKTDVVGPDGGNTTFFGTDIAGDSDSFPNFFGTSAAAPHLAGLAALMLDANPSLTPAQIEQALEQTAIDMDDPDVAGFQTGFDAATGWGLVNGVDALYKTFTPTAPALAAGSDSGLSNSDRITNDNTPTIIGTVPADSYVRVYVDGVQSGTPQQLTGGATQFSITTAALTQGNHSIAIRVAKNSSTSLANLSNTSGALSVMIDTVAPSAPSIPDLLAADDSGSSNVDNITKITTPRFTGTAEAGATITLLEGAASRGTGVAAGGAWTITSSALSSAAHSLKARATDVAGNVSADSSTLAITVDTSAPSAPSIPDLLAADDGGQSNVDNLTSIATPRFTGTAEAGATITLLEGAMPLGTGVATGGAWTVTSSALSSALHNVKARATDVAGNASVDSSTLAVTIDAIAPRVAGVAIIGTNSNDVGGGRYPIPTGSGLQLKTVPIGGAYRIEIEFNKPMDVSTITNSVLWLVNKQGGPTITPNGATVTASAGNTKFTWEFVSKPFAATAYQLTLSNNVIKSVAGAYLDGEFTNPVDVDQPPAAVLNLPSGNGSPGGAFTFDFVNLPSDANRDNVVNGQDLILWKSNYGGPDSFTTGDGGGDGTTDGSDFIEWQREYTKSFNNLMLVNAASTSLATVAGVTVSGSNSTHDAYFVPTGSGEQLRTIPLSGADTIAIAFSSDVTLVGDELSIYGADSGTNYGLVYEGYDALTHTASWRVADGALPHDQLIIELAEGVVDSLGSPVDPEWLNPQVVASTDDYLRDLSVVGAGDGFVGGAFRFHLNVLPGDFNLDNKVNLDDRELQNENLGMIMTGAEFTDGDFDGDGDVDSNDESALLAVIYVGTIDYTAFADVVAPRVTSVWFDGSNSTHVPYMVPTGSGEQLRTVPIGGIDTIKLAFDEGVTLNGTELTAYGVKTGTTYSLSYIGYGNGVATWKLAGGATLPAEQLLLRLEDSIVDAAGNALDGEFTNPWTLVDPSGSSSSMPSGDGEAGGDFRFRATILPGDFNRDNVYNAADTSIYAANYGLTAATHADGDISGDGVVDGSDFLKLQTQAANDFTNWKSIEPGMILVSSVADEGDDSDYSIGDVTLREALARAYAQAGDDVIAFRDTLSGQTINLSLGQLGINSNVTIRGLGAGALTIYAGGASRVISVSSGVTATISGLGITGGSVNGDGAGIYNSNGNLTLTGVVVTGNNATGLSGLGGGLFSQGGSVTVTDSEFHNNTATRGGAIRTQYGTTLAISGSALYNNAASGVEGALSTHQTTAMIKNSTFSGNSAVNGGGAIRTNGTGQMTIVNSTIAYNNTTAGYGGGIQVTGAGTVTLHNTILAANTAGASAFQDVIGALSAASSYNLIGQVGGSGLTNNVNGNKVGTATVLIDPLLAPLGDYGGSTKTHALLQGSLAIDAGSNDEVDGLLFDQRRRVRLVDGDNDGDLRVDIGSYEVEYDEFFASLGA